MGCQPRQQAVNMNFETDLSNYNILAVDDVPINLTLVEKMLSKFHITIRKAGNGLEAMREIIARKPDLMLLDLMMPYMDGFEVLNRVRENPEWAEMRIIVLSALNTNEDIVKAYEAGANDFITKPIILEKLINGVHSQLIYVNSLKKS